jgi:rfaE bifunctional protein kinase chain/domain
MVVLANVLSRLHPEKILVVGDLLLDSYTIGKARRISPEAPVPIVDVLSENSLPGGAGNVTLNLLSLGAQVIPMGRIGKDWGGEFLIKAFQAEGMSTSALFVQDNYSTPVKNRIIVNQQQIVRIDRETIVPLCKDVEQRLIDQLPLLLEGVKVVAVSDYGKGFLTSTLLQAIYREANLRNIIIITDPKGTDFRKYQGTTIIKPNLSEAYAATNSPNHTPLEQVAQGVIAQSQANYLMVTRSEEGISLFKNSGERSDFPVHAKEVKDVTGAGDTVLAMLAHALANELSYDEAVQLCNIAAGIAIEHVGCMRVTLSDMAHRLFESSKSHKVFRQEHFFVLKEILKNQSYDLLTISPQMEALTPVLYQSIKEISQNSETLLVYIEDKRENSLLINMLSSLREVSFIVHQLDCLNALRACVTPRNTHVFEGHAGG